MQPVEQVAGGHRDLAEGLRGDIACAAMHPDGQSGGIEGRESLRHERGGDPCEHVSCAGRGHAGIAGVVVRLSRVVDNQRRRPLQHDHGVDRTSQRGRLAFEHDPVAGAGG